MFLYLLRMGLKFGVRTAVFYDPFDCALAGVLRRFGVYERVIYFALDWLPSGNLRVGVWSRLSKGVYFPVMDRFASRWSDLTVNQTDLIATARTEYWGARMPRKEIVYQPRLVMRAAHDSAAGTRRKILFLGFARTDSGLDLLLGALPRLRESLGDITIKIIGGSTPTLTEFQRRARENGLDRWIEHIPQVPRQSFADVFSDCFCGVNLITTSDSYSSKTIPGKIMDYFQYLLPVVVTPNVGPITEVVREHHIGRVVAPSVDEVAAALTDLCRRRDEFVQNLRAYIGCRPYTSVEQLLREAYGEDNPQ